MKFFSYDSKFGQIFIKICYACFLNLLWLGCSIPIFTIGASTAALYSVTLKIVEDEEYNVTAMFFKAFKENFKQATVIWLIMLLIGVILGTDAYILYHLYRNTSGLISIVSTIGLALIIAAAVVYVIVNLYIFPLTASVTNTTKNMFKNSLLIGLRYLFCSIMLFAIHFAMFFAVVAIFTPLIIFGEGMCALLSSYLLINVIKNVSYDPNKANKEVPHGC